MRLLRFQNGTVTGLETFVGSDLPPYAILSHTWGSDDDEFSFSDAMNGSGRDKPGFRKVQFCLEKSLHVGISYAWIDTCCIDQTSAVELSESINSMFKWYQQSAVCFVYLADVANQHEEKEVFGNSRWFTRGWTSQELIAPRKVWFFAANGNYLGDRQSLSKKIEQTTGIQRDVLRGRPCSNVSVETRLRWAARRQTKREEDGAYSLLGLFGAFMSPIYGEGRDHAFKRLEREIAQASMATSDGISIRFPTSTQHASPPPHQSNTTHRVSGPRGMSSDPMGPSPMYYRPSIHRFAPAPSSPPSPVEPYPRQKVYLSHYKSAPNYPLPSTPYAPSFPQAVYLGRPSPVEYQQPLPFGPHAPQSERCEDLPLADHRSTTQSADDSLSLSTVSSSTTNEDSPPTESTLGSPYNDPKKHVSRTGPYHSFAPSTPTSRMAPYKFGQRERFWYWLGDLGSSSKRYDDNKVTRKRVYV